VTFYCLLAHVSYRPEELHEGLFAPCWWGSWRGGQGDQAKHLSPVGLLPIGRGEYWHARSVFEGFQKDQIDVGEASVFVRHGGDGLPVVLLHGHPRTSATWHRVAPAAGPARLHGRLPRPSRIRPVARTGADAGPHHAFQAGCGS
jgi:hypothetical protein